MNKSEEIEKIDKRIFAIYMADSLSDEDYRLIDELEEKKNVLRGEKV